MKVSVYCAVYNHAAYIESALEGFVSQKTNFEYEVFVHDDASIDESTEIILYYAKCYPNIIKPIIQHQNQYSQGINILEQHVYPLMSGDYIALCEGDDYWCDCNKLQLQVDFLDEHPEHSACVHNTVRKNLAKKRERIQYSQIAEKDIGFEDVIQGGGVSYHTSSLMFRRCFFENRPAYYKKAKGFDDYPMAIHLSLNGKIHYFPNVMSVYRFGTEGSWSRRIAKNHSQQIITYQSIVEMLTEVNIYTERKYETIINEVILQTQYQLEEIKGNYSKLRLYPFSKYYEQQSNIYKMKTYIKQWIYPIYRLYRTLKT